MSLAEKYQLSLNEKRVIRFKPRHPNKEAIDGVVLSIKKTFVVLYSVYDLQFWSIVVLPKKWIRGYRDGEYEDGYNEVIQRLGLNRNLTVPEWLLECETLTDVLRAMKRRDIWPVVEILYGKEDKTASALYIGPIMDVGDASFSIYCYDATAKWEKVYELDIAEIFRIETGDSYSRYFNEYMRKYKTPLKSNGKRAN
jgi:hypothetical protein